MSYCRYILLLVLLCARFSSASAQNIVVQKFQLDESDLTANTAGTTVMDQNGQKCALIKIETTQTGFTFDVGLLGVVKTEQHPGEVWVYVPEGVKRITITHPQLGILRDHDLGMTLKRARTYLLRLITGEVQTLVRQARASQFVVFQLTPANAIVELNGEVLTNIEGASTKFLPFGTYDYSVKAPNYLSEVGKITVNDPKNKHVLNVKLRPNFGQVTLTVDNNAEIWVNGELKGKGQWTGNLVAGENYLETRLPNSWPMGKQLNYVVSDKTQTIHLDAPIPFHGELNINSTPLFADVSIDNKPVGQTPLYLTDLLVGKHTIKITKSGYESYQADVDIKENETSNLNAKLNPIDAPAPAVKDVAKVSNSKENSVSSTNVTDNILSFTVNGITFNMVHVPSGSFMMGNDKIRNERPSHNVTLSDYYIGETEVTQALWNAVMGENPSYFQGEELPVECVSWDDCQKFVKKLNELTGRQFSMPTEAEWEYAARNAGKDNYSYSGGNKLRSLAWYSINTSSMPRSVKTKKPNGLGLYDMSGNIFEWCYDWYGAYNRDASKDPTGPSEGTRRVIRGGSWGYDETYCTVTKRVFYSPDLRSYSIGFRLALK